MKNKLLFPIALLVTSVLFACGEQVPSNSNSNPTTSQGSQDTTSITLPSISNPAPVEEEYAIRVTAPTGVEYSLNKQKAKKGEEVTLTITSLAPGYTIKRVLLNNSTEVRGSNNVYTFTMPNRSASINIEVNVDGDVTLVGQIAANLILNKETGIYEAKNVKVDSPKAEVFFSYQIKKDGEAVILDSTDLDETKCFADITFSYGTDDGELQLASGATYNFFYDPSAQYPCYVQRVSVDVLPQDVKSLYTLFDGSMRSDTACHETGLTGIDYSITDLEKTNPLKMTYSYREYTNNISFATVQDVLTEKKYYVYKEYNEANQLYTVVDTYAKALGNDDIFRLEYNNHGSHSAKLDVVETDSDNNTRFEISKRKALRNVNNSAHHGYYLERDFMDAYRVGYSDDYSSSSSINISSTKLDNGFKTVIDSFIEYDTEGDSYYEARHEAYQFDVEIEFTTHGAVKALSYEKVKFTKQEWDFVKHAPLYGQEGSIVKKITVNNQYDSITSGTPDFDKSKYFIQSFDNLQFYNSKTNAPTDDGKSYVHYMDSIRLVKANENDKLANLKTCEFTPATALDLWQYSATESSDESVIAKLPTDRYDQMTACGIGTSTVSFTNHTKNSGIKKDLEITVTATQKFHSMYLNSYSNPDITTANSANIIAGQIAKYQVGVTPSSAPVVFDALVDPNYDHYLKVVSTSGGYLTLDASGAKDIKEPVDVKVKCTSDWYDSAVTNKYTMFTFTIIPQAASPLGKWQMEGTTAADPVYMTFTDDVYEGKVSSGYEGAKMGEITDTLDGITDTFKFYYLFENGRLSARLYEVNIKSSTDYSSDPLDFYIDFYYEASTNRYGVALFEYTYDSYYEDMVCYSIYGEVTMDGEINSYAAFSKVE